MRTAMQIAQEVFYSVLVYVPKELSCLITDYVVSIFVSNASTPLYDYWQKFHHPMDRMDLKTFFMSSKNNLTLRASRASPHVFGFLWELNEEKPLRTVRIASDGMGEFKLMFDNVILSNDEHYLYASGFRFVDPQKSETTLFRIPITFPIYGVLQSDMQLRMKSFDVGTIQGCRYFSRLLPVPGTSDVLFWSLGGYDRETETSLVYVRSLCETLTVMHEYYIQTEQRILCAGRTGFYSFLESQREKIMFTPYEQSGETHVFAETKILFPSCYEYCCGREYDPFVELVFNHTAIRFERQEWTAKTPVVRVGATVPLALPFLIPAKTKSRYAHSRLALTRSINACCLCKKEKNYVLSWSKLL